MVGLVGRVSGGSPPRASLFPCRRMLPMKHSIRKASLSYKDTRFVRICDRMRLPLIAAPMFLVSGIDLVVAACRNGVIGSFPTANCRTPEELAHWLATICWRLRDHEEATGTVAAPFCPNLIVHASNRRLAEDLGVVLAHGPEIVITSVGSPASVVAPLHDAGALVFADVATIRHTERAIAAGADGLVLLTAGAGGQTGWLNPFAFVRAVRKFFAGPVVLAGGISAARPFVPQSRSVATSPIWARGSLRPMRVWRHKPIRIWSSPHPPMTSC